MPVDQGGVRLSALDTNRFGIVVARADRVTRDRVDEVFDFCASNRVKLLICRSNVEDVDASNALIARLCEIMDTLVYYQDEIANEAYLGTGDPRISLMEHEDADAVESIARECFRDYSGHYHADRRLDRDACTEVYASWARALCEPADGSFVLVAGDPGERVGFSAFRQDASGVGELVLGAVLPAARGAGLYRQLTLAGMLRLQASGAKRFITSTHLSNWGAQRSWTAAGLHPYSAYHTFHRWF
jgi:ribosomal protein S18 acetylase RimI-like enzyme